jgi:spermatogenesis-associated protein 2
MTSYGRDPLEELWKEILQIQWRYLETEESMQKIDERKLLEGRLKEYISVVPHDRKFFLPETEQILRKSITQMKDFSAFKGADGFESISHYANNLFTKPWRKEYRVIKVNKLIQFQSRQRSHKSFSIFRCTRDFTSTKSKII